MDYLLHITVHVYAEEKLEDQILTLHSKNYGIIGKEIIAPLRRINGRGYYIEKDQDTFTVKELWDIQKCKEVVYASTSERMGQ